jgi:hypothetical protein
MRIIRMLKKLPCCSIIAVILCSLFSTGSNCFVLDTIDVRKRTIHLVLLQIYERQGLIEQEITELKELVTEEPKGFTYRAKLGNLLLSQRKAMEALSVFKDGLTANPHDYCWHALMSKCYEQMGLCSEAEEEWQKGKVFPVKQRHDPVRLRNAPVRLRNDIDDIAGQ